MIVIYDKANTLTLHYANESGGIDKFRFVPGNNELTSDMWNAIKEYNEKNMEHYERYLFPLNEEAAGDDGLQYEKLNAREVGLLIENCQDVDELEGLKIVETDGKDRKSVLKEIDSKIKKITSFTDKVDADRE